MGLQFCVRELNVCQTAHNCSILTLLCWGYHASYLVCSPPLMKQLQYMAIGFRTSKPR